MIKKINYKHKTSIVKIILEALMLILSLSMILPFYYLVVNTLKDVASAAKFPLSIPQFPLYLKNYIEAIEIMKFPLAFRNTLIITFSTLIIVIVFGSLAAYSVARRKHSFYKIIMIYFLLGFMVPVQTTMIPLFLLMQNLELMNKLYGVILLASGTCSFAIFLYQGFINSVPLELEESAKMDGASVWKTFWRIVFPLLKPITVTLSIFHVMGTWNDYITPKLFLSSRANTTLMLELFRCVGEFANNWKVMMSAIVIIMSPLVIFYVFMQRYIITGLTNGAVKG